MKTITIILQCLLALLVCAGADEKDYPPTPPASAIVAQVRNVAAKKEPHYAAATVSRVQLKDVAAVSPVQPPDPFTLRRALVWSKPHGQFMNQLLKDIDAAKERGDTVEYEALTKRYAAWADKYLRR